MNSPFFLVPRSANGTSGPSTRLRIGELVIGRHDESDIYIPDPTVSRKHALLNVALQGIVVTDLRSRGGTWVNSERIKCAKILPGNQIRIGEVRFVITVAPNSEYGLLTNLETTDPQSGAVANAKSAAKLTPRQSEVLKWLVQGLQQKEVAGKMHISPETVHNHIRAIYAAYDVHSIVELLLKVLPAT